MLPLLLHLLLIAMSLQCKCEAEADPQFLEAHPYGDPIAAHLAAAPHDVAHSVTTTVKHAYQDVTTKY